MNLMGGGGNRCAGPYQQTRDTRRTFPKIWGSENAVFLPLKVDIRFYCTDVQFRRTMTSPFPLPGKDLRPSGSWPGARVSQHNSHLARDRYMRFCSKTSGLQCG